MDLVEVDAVGTEALRLASTARTMRSASAGAVGPGRHAEAALGGDDHLVAGLRAAIHSPITRSDRPSWP